ncbi:hypothetical protein BCR37DRAFT_382557 [Protomyces lactucae-debilis]|uniref:Cation-transporting ATPase 4 n=1 Tax=Protomyces lactucae-debilis TaxID=2754530 RepID=A0A1Y2F1D5_PROLT|nr:uncharacterized protein BCR37DRAFT_382557 [Protomyces lactucae-debilis]ORY77669.1 hypothetical protein BCR37DRAFT_382557 [Protomyces lactucae-debilis]
MGWDGLACTRLVCLWPSLFLFFSELAVDGESSSCLPTDFWNIRGLHQSWTQYTDTPLASGQRQIPRACIDRKMHLLVDSPLVVGASLHNPRPRILHPYVLPYIVLYPIWAYVYNYKYNEWLGSEEWTFITIVTLITTQSLLWLVGHWSIAAKAWTRYSRASSIATAKSIKIVPAVDQGSPEICALDSTQYAGEKEREISFTFQKKKFIFDTDRKVFREVIFPIDQQPSIAKYQGTSGLSSSKALETAERLYGFNRFDIPIPTFAELFKEHAVAPFFVFQIFCVGLWCLDEYWYYSLFTGFMLVAFECTVVIQRQKTLNEFRTMSIKPYPIMVYRLNKWIEVQTDELFPGDIVSVTRSKDDAGVPCDILLMSGSCIVNEAMLSGESTPLLKESIELRASTELVDLGGLDKNALLSGGTKVLQVTPAQSSDKIKVKPAPNGGVLGVVLRTGFETQQGSLVRTMIYSTERVSANNVEALFFILFLLVFAIAASWYVWTNGVLQERPKKKLLLDCILIVTSVVPPELPMELSLSVNSSLAALSKHSIFCTEPFRIPFAGRVDVCCFDKTGTLTEEDLVVEGVAGLSGDFDKLQDIGSSPTETALVLASAHSVVRLDDGTTVGDPMERATLTSIGWRVAAADQIFPPAASDAFRGDSITVKRRFQFSSALKRQSTVSSLANKERKGSKLLCSVKGAPETIKTMLTYVPEGYDQTFKHFTRNGSRVIALGFKYMAETLSSKQINDLERSAVESSLQFAGFLIFSCPLKPDAKDTVKELNQSSHRVIMITGDNPLTACHVAREVEIVDRRTLILDAVETETGSNILWRSVDETETFPFDAAQPLPRKLIDNYDLCVTGYALSQMAASATMKDIIRYTWVYARVSPTQKEFILNELKYMGYTTLMCGDGTNDVGALKQAHVGVALLNGSEDDLKKIAEHAQTTRLRAVYDKQSELLARWNRPPPPVPKPIAHLYPPGPSNPHRLARLTEQGKTPSEIKAADDLIVAQTALTKSGDEKTSASEKPKPGPGGSMMDNMLAQMSELEDDDDTPPTIKLGDASCAAPFTSKLAKVGAIGSILRQGRCTLVATIQMYKILALNCLISAYSLSVLYLDGIKFGDGQVTISGMLMSVCFMCISRARPLEKLSKERPHPGIFNVYIIGSILGQFAVHVATLIFISQYIQRTHPKEPKIDLEAKFEPSLLNSGIYLLQLTQQISTFSLNYQGRPFRESIRENKYMYWGLVSVGALAFSCSTEFIPEVNQQLKLVKFTDLFKVVITATMLVDYGLCYVIEQFFKRFFSDSAAKDIARR